MAQAKNTNAATKQTVAMKNAEVKKALDATLTNLGALTRVRRSHDLPKGLRKSVLSIDSVVIINPGVRSAAKANYSEPIIEKIKSKASSILGEAEGHLAPFLASSTGSYTGHNEDIIGINAKRAYANKRNLVADAPWSHSTRFDLVDLLQYRQKLYLNDFVAVRLFNHVMIKKALRQSIPSFKTIAANGGRHIVFTSGLDHNNVKLFLQAFNEEYGESSMWSEVEDFDTRLVSGSINYVDGVSGSIFDRSPIFDGGDDHDSGVCSTYAAKLLLDDHDCEIIFINIPTVATNIGYEALMSQTNYIDNDQSIKDVIAIDNKNLLDEFNPKIEREYEFVFRRFLKRVFDSSSYNDERAADRCSKYRVSSVGDITRVIARLQQEVFVFQSKGLAQNAPAAAKVVSSAPALIQDVFSRHTSQMDVANLYRCINHFSANEAPFLSSKWSEGKAAKGGKCCNGCDEKDSIIPCGEYRYLSALQHSIGNKITQMWDGYDSGASLLRTVIMFQLSPSPMQFIASIRAELLRIAHRNIVDMYTKGFYQRNGAVIHAMNNLYSDNVTDVYLFTDTHPDIVWSYRWNKSYAVIIPQSDVPTKMTISLLKGNDYAIEKYYSEFFGTIGIISKSLANVILPG